MKQTVGPNGCIAALNFADNNSLEKMTIDNTEHLGKRFLRRYKERKKLNEDLQMSLIFNFL